MSLDSRIFPKYKQVKLLECKYTESETNNYSACYNNGRCFKQIQEERMASRYFLKIMCACINSDCFWTNLIQFLSPEIYVFEQNTIKKAIYAILKRLICLLFREYSRI